MNLLEIYEWTSIDWNWLRLDDLNYEIIRNATIELNKIHF